MRPDALRLSYGPHPSQFGELHLPGAGRAWPVCVVIHGGFWRARFDLSLGAPLAEDLAGRGIAAWNIEYRRLGSAADGGGWPTTFVDVADAVDLLAGEGQRAADGRLDLTRVVALGHSAGGHLAGWLAGRPALADRLPNVAPKVPLSGVVSQAGVLDLEAGSRDRLSGGVVDELLGGDPSSRTAEVAMASPIRLLPFGIPTLCVHGERDEVVPFSQSERFVAAARATGDHSDLVALPDGDHFGVITVGDPGWTACAHGVMRLCGLPPL